VAEKYRVTTSTRAVAWLTSVMARLGVGNFVVLTTTGRKSGQARSVTLAPISDGDAEYLVSPYGEVAWALNVRANPRASLRRRSTETDVELVEVTGLKPQLIKEYYERESFARRFMDVPGDATVADFASVPERFPVFRIDDKG
jgi:deazaflavin-dependent oxidoreductase (nitroreductase family)